jgi:hypothetical protein
MIKKSNGRPDGNPKRPPQKSPFNWGQHITKRTQSGGKNPTFKQRLRAAKTGYLSISSHLSEDLKKEILERVRLLFPNLRIGSFQTEFEDTPDWKDHLKSFISDIDVLVIAYGPTRLIGGGVNREMALARRLNKLIVTFSIESGLPTLYFGYDVIEEEGKAKGIRLRSQKREREEVTI